MTRWRNRECVSKNRKILTGVFAAFAMASSAVYAADVTEETPAPPSMPANAFSWDGAYAGLHAGYASGWGFGGFAGYNIGFGSGAIFGVEGDLNYVWNEQVYSGVTVGTGLNGSARLRVGYGVERALLYAAGGWTGSDFKVRGRGFDERDTLNGWTLGAGIDYAVSDRIFTRLEYRYDNFGTRNILGVDTDLNQHAVLVGLGVKF
ncbi:MAG: outer membrane protein [Allorhizobium sp.]